MGALGHAALVAIVAEGQAKLVKKTAQDLQAAAYVALVMARNAWKANPTGPLLIARDQAQAVFDAAKWESQRLSFVVLNKHFISVSAVDLAKQAGDYKPMTKVDAVAAAVAANAAVAAANVTIQAAITAIQANQNVDANKAIVVAAVNTMLDAGADTTQYAGIAATYAATAAVAAIPVYGYPAAEVLDDVLGATTAIGVIVDSLVKTADSFTTTVISTINTIFGPPPTTPVNDMLGIRGDLGLDNVTTGISTACDDCTDACADCADAAGDCGDGDGGY